MKKVGDKYYFVPGDKDVPAEVQALGVKKAFTSFTSPEPFNLVKVDWGTQAVSLLWYEGLGEVPHPHLKHSIFIPAEDKFFECRKARKYGDNPPIFHRTEIVMPGDWPEFAFITTKEEMAGMYDKEHLRKIGYKKYWNELCHEKGMMKSLVKE